MSFKKILTEHEYLELNCVIHLPQGFFVKNIFAYDWIKLTSGSFNPYPAFGLTVV